MARRKFRSKTRSRAPKTINAARIVEATLIASAVTQGFFNVGIGDFVMSKSSMNPSQITARELISGLTGGSYVTLTTSSTPAFNQNQGNYMKTVTSGSNFGDMVKQNLSSNGAQMVGSLILIPAGFKVFNKLTSKPRSMANQALKMSGLPVRV